MFKEATGTDSEFIIDTIFVKKVMDDISA